MHVVPIKTTEQQAALMMHRSRELLVGQRMALVNALRGHLAELGIVTAKGIHRVADLLAELVGAENTKIPPLARLIERQPTKVVAIALANKSVRIIWAMLRRGAAYRAPTIDAVAAAAA